MIRCVQCAPSDPLHSALYQHVRHDYFRDQKGRVCLCHHKPWHRDGGVCWGGGGVLNNVFAACVIDGVIDHQGCGGGASWEARAKGRIGLE